MLLVAAADGYGRTGLVLWIVRWGGVDDRAGGWCVGLGSYGVGGGFDGRLGGSVVDMAACRWKSGV